MDRRLYEDDFYLWSQDQAAALRAAGARQPASGANALDWDLLAEEVEDLGGSQLRECLSRTRTVIEHLFKLAWSSQEAPCSGWRNTIRVQRTDLKLALTPTIRRKVEARLEELHVQAGHLVAAAFADDEPTVACDLSLRWSFAALLGETDDPLR
jgi:hypothetical protein